MLAGINIIQKKNGTFVYDLVLVISRSKDCEF